MGNCVSAPPSCKNPGCGWAAAEHCSGYCKRCFAQQKAASAAAPQPRPIVVANIPPPADTSGYRPRPSVYTQPQSQPQYQQQPQYPSQQQYLSPAPGGPPMQISPPPPTYDNKQAAPMPQQQNGSLHPPSYVQAQQHPPTYAPAPVYQGYPSPQQPQAYYSPQPQQYQQQQPLPVANVACPSCRCALYMPPGQAQARCPSCNTVFARPGYQTQTYQQPQQSVAPVSRSGGGTALALGAGAGLLGGLLLADMLS